VPLETITHFLNESGYQNLYHPTSVNKSLNMSSLKQKERVLWHEAGHIATAYYNQLHYGGYGTEAIVVVRQHMINDSYDYKGAHVPIEPPGYDPAAPIKHPAAKVAILAYGCIFEVIRYDQPLNNCFIHNQYAHGNDDYNKVGGVAYRFQFFDNRQKLYDCIATHFETIKENPEWKELFSINMTDLVQSDEDQFTINPEELKRRMDDFLRKHELHYNRLVEQLTDIFQSYGHT
jgi:hypothetical protein